jgi:predicted transcriptional regulator
MGGLSNFETGQIVSARLAGVSVTKTATLLGVSRATVSTVMSAYTNHGKTTLAKRNGEQNSTLRERYSYILRRILLKNCKITAA